MDIFAATMICEGVEPADEETTIAAWQFLIDQNICWQLQGWFGRQAVALIAEGICKPANGQPSKEIIKRARLARQIQRQIGG